MIALAAILSGCDAVASRCAAQTTTNVPPSNEEMALLEAVRARIEADEELLANVWLLDADEATGTVTVGLDSRTTEICDQLHAAYGPLVDVLGPPERP